MMMTEIQKLLAERPFRSFSIVTSAGMHHLVASPEHASVSPKKTQITIYFDDDSAVWVSALHITAVQQAAAASPQAA